MLTATQHSVLELIRVKPERWWCAYDLQARLSTLQALVKKGLLISKSEYGAIIFPRNEIWFKLKEENHG